MSALVSLIFQPRPGHEDRGTLADIRGPIRLQRGDDMKLFGVLNLETAFEEARFSLGIRSATLIDADLRSERLHFMASLYFRCGELQRSPLPIWCSIR
jgi:hypothetical protein